MSHTYFLIIVLIIYINHNSGHRVKRIVGGIPAEKPAYDDPIVYIRLGGRNARIQGIHDFPHFVFRGIRYAYPPTGRDRFQRPRQFFLEGHVNATMYPPPCMQGIPGESRVVGDEDCLFLNVFTPDLPQGTEGLPVVIWIHGGGFRYGSASQYGVRHLVGKRLVIVTIQYRLGSLGFLGTGTQELPGNSALWDMAMAVQWARNYIGFFGGNPYQIVVMGHGTGASSALLVALNNVAKGYTSGVIALSGTAISHWAVDNTPMNTAKEVADYQGCPTASVITMIKCLQAIPPTSIIEGDTYIASNRLQARGFTSGIQGQLGTIPIREVRYDGRSLPPMVEGDPMDKMNNKETPKIPLFTGVTKDETCNAINEFENDILKKLKSVPQFLDDVLIRDLQSFTGLGRKGRSENSSDELLSLLDPLKFRKYVSVSTVAEGLNKISEITADALFNLPAFLTANLWSKTGAPVFLYRFEHSGRLKTAHHFLKGFPIIGNVDGNEANNNTVGHGEDLIYLFEARTLNGEVIPDAEEYFTEEDEKVRNIFTEMISTFARHGKINIGNKEISSFSGDSNNYIQINSKPKLLDNFRFCELALWSGLTNRLKTSSCQLLQVIDTQLTNLGTPLFDLLNSANSKTVPHKFNLANPLEQLGKVQNVLNIDGGNKSRKGQIGILGIL